jgi:hypothetical protein
MGMATGRSLRALPGPSPRQCGGVCFANRAIYVVLANYGQVDVSLETTESYVSLNHPSISATARWSLEPRSLLMLKTT